MDTLKEWETIMNLKILKGWGIYQIFNPKSAEIYTWNVYVILNLVLNIFTQIISGLSPVGFFFDEYNLYGYIDYFLVGCIVCTHYKLSIMVMMLLHKKNKIWDLLAVTKYEFLKSTIYIRKIPILNKYYNKTKRFTNIYSVLIIMVYIQWTLVPWVINQFLNNNAANQRLEKIINLPYPVTPQTYNQYYVFFNIFEVVLPFMIMYNAVVIDFILISFYYAFIGQFTIIIETFQNIGYKEKTLSGEIF